MSCPGELILLSCTAMISRHLDVFAMVVTALLWLRKGQCQSFYRVHIASLPLTQATPTTFKAGRGRLRVFFHLRKGRGRLHVILHFGLVVRYRLSLSPLNSTKNSSCPPAHTPPRSVRLPSGMYTVQMEYATTASSVSTEERAMSMSAARSAAHNAAVATARRLAFLNMTACPAVRAAFPPTSRTAPSAAPLHA